MLPPKEVGWLTIADVGIKISSEDLFITNLPPEKNIPDFKCKPWKDRYDADISVTISSNYSLPCIGNKIISSKNNHWRLYSTNEGFLDCRFHNKDSQIPFKWASIDQHYKKIDIGVNVQGHQASENCQHVAVEPCQLVTDLKLLTPALLNNRTLLLHSSGGMIKNKAFILAGPSGIGKSTIAKLLSKAGHSMFSDECMAVKKKVEKNWIAYGTPWASSANIIRNDSAPLAAILFLQKAKTTHVRPLTKAESLKRIIQFCCIPWHLPDFAEIALSVIDRLLIEIPFYELNCSLTDQPVETIEQLALSL